MPIAVTLLLLWLALSYSAFQRGNHALAGLYLAAGIALTVFRLSRGRGMSV